MLIVCLIVSALTLQARSPVPDPAQQKEAEKVVREVFKDEYAKKTPADRAALAAKMRAEAGSSKADMATAFVLYNEAQDLFTQAGEIDKSLDTIDELAKTFAVDGWALKSAALALAWKASKSGEDAARLGAAHLRLAGEAAQQDVYEVAEKSVQAASALAKKAGSITLASRAANKAKEVSDFKSKFERLKKARETIASNPDDQAANFAVGQFQAVFKSSWEVGLPLLAKGSDPAYKAAADRELAPPKDASGQSAVADSWWDLAEKEAGAGRDNLRAHAIVWYEKAKEQLSGIAKTKADKRIQEVRFEKLNRGTWVDVTDAKLYGKTASPLELTNAARVPLLKMPPGVFDGLLVRVKVKSGGSLSVQYDPQKYGMHLNATDGHFEAQHLEGNNWKYDIDVVCPAKAEYVLAVLIMEGECVFYLDGRESFRRTAVIDYVTGVQFQTWSGKVQFDQIKLRKRE